MALGPSQADDEAIRQAHARLLEDRTLQFEMAAFEPPEPPAWLAWVAELFGAVAPFLMWIFWGGLALGAALVLFFIAREIIRLRFPGRRKPKTIDAPEPEWRPDAQAARTLLADADRLAAEGRFGEAVHLLLIRSIEDIDSRRPRTVKPALTARDIASLEALPPSARPAFRQIAAVVELSLFGGAEVSGERFSACRQAYEDFALPSGWTA